MSVKIGVVVPHYCDRRRLLWVLHALAAQDFPLGDLQVVVADDGSPTAPTLPTLPELGYRCSLVRQEDLGFRAAAARNLGAAAVEGDLLVFLDGDTIPSPGYLAAMARGFEHVGSGFLAVGRRLHADFEDCADSQVAQWVRDGPPAQRVLEAPAWLADGYARTADLRAAGEEDFRLVISAVLAMDRCLFERAGGFDETMTGYGGEDWELAWRCWLLGARLQHLPEALAWHDGPHAGGRSGHRSAARAVKDAESLALAARITLPSVRGRGLMWEQPDIVVGLHGTHSEPQLFLTMLALLRDSDVGVWLTDYDEVPAAVAGDPRVRTGPPPQRVRYRARYQVDVWAPLQLTKTLADACAADEIDVPGVLLIRGTRRMALGSTGPESSALPDWARRVPDDGLEQIIGEGGTA